MSRMVQKAWAELCGLLAMVEHHYEAVLVAGIAGGAVVFIGVSESVAVLLSRISRAAWRASNRTIPISGVDEVGEGDLGDLCSEVVVALFPCPVTAFLALCWAIPWLPRARTRHQIKNPAPRQAPLKGSTRCAGFICPLRARPKRVEPQPNFNRDGYVID